MLLKSELWFWNLKNMLAELLDPGLNSPLSMQPRALFWEWGHYSTSDLDMSNDAKPATCDEDLAAEILNRGGSTSDDELPPEKRRVTSCWWTKYIRSIWPCSSWYRRTNLPLQKWSLAGALSMFPHQKGKESYAEADPKPQTPGTSPWMSTLAPSERGSWTFRKMKSGNKFRMPSFVPQGHCVVCGLRSKNKN